MYVSLCHWFVVSCFTLCGVTDSQFISGFSCALVNDRGNVYNLEAYVHAFSGNAVALVKLGHPDVGRAEHVLIFCAAIKKQQQQRYNLSERVFTLEFEELAVQCLCNYSNTNSYLWYVSPWNQVVHAHCTCIKCFTK